MEKPELKRLPLECCHSVKCILEGCTFWQSISTGQTGPQGSPHTTLLSQCGLPQSLYLRRSLESVRGAAEAVRTFGFTGDPGSLLEGGAE